MPAKTAADCLSDFSIKKFVIENEYSERQIKSKFREVYDLVLRDSKYINTGNFVKNCSNDAKILFDSYDKIYFGGDIKKVIGKVPLKFRLSKRMTSSAGATKIIRHKNGDSISYEIVFAIDMLYQNFKEGDRAVVVNGLQCSDRLEALQRVMEHEIVHLIEYAIWSNSSCSHGRFHSIAKRFFGHADYKHKLITRSERAIKTFGINIGTQVSFKHEGRTYIGFVRRLGKRATVLVNDLGGERYSDGNYYRKFYIPLIMLQRKIS